MPKISIIVPVYKVEKYLRRCLDSIVAQTFTNWECILVDDGSPDNSGKICDEYAEKDTRFRVIHQENQGVSAARNKGLDEAKGEWIGFVDSDDWIEPNMYEYLYSNAIKTKADVVICGFVGQSKTHIKKMCGTEEAQIFLFTPNGFGGFSFLRLINATKVQDIRFNPKLTYLEDVSFFYNLFKICNAVYWDNEPLYNYFQRDDSVTHKYGLSEDAKGGLLFLDSIIAAEKNNKIKKSIICCKLNMCLFLVSHYTAKKDIKNDSYVLLKQYIKYYIPRLFFYKDFGWKNKIKALAISNTLLSKLFIWCRLF
jgi:glycosyltransferase involved in cell wall biosynthesis